MGLVLKDSGGDKLFFKCLSPPRGDLSCCGETSCNTGFDKTAEKVISGDKSLPRPVKLTAD